MFLLHTHFYVNFVFVFFPLFGSMVHCLLLLWYTSGCIYSFYIVYVPFVHLVSYLLLLLFMFATTFICYF